MKKYVLFFTMLLWGCMCFAQDKQAILKVLETQRLAWNRGDLETFMQGYWKSDSLLFVGSDGPKYGWQTTLDNYKKSYPDKAAMGQLKFDILKVQLLDKTNAFVLGGWQLQRQSDAPGGYFTLLLRKIKGEWKVVSDHSS
ncbi:nuclear transport factor 2 family protein [Mucilaginibacter sp. Bleaf8]|uniref:YybH family protein n=1 Tax=Mucilaginibacter sp. Bleaf8 TaxID=2834430 RepID=UPI001BCCACDD|nr:nuclear transport factor 2 family protein [Mucilaginibacter sp. Bleaf8]MBS7564329.1 nuclear transport factor 2 family protein [Mucilaginibacter sp. Bleaf8]